MRTKEEIDDKMHELFCEKRKLENADSFEHGLLEKMVHKQAIDAKLEMLDWCKGE
jgi:hypothetical protein